MDFGVWVALAQRCAHWLAQDDVAGIVVTHGTDTMEETAFFLHSVLAPAKPVVLTGAMRPATSAAADGPQNLADALTVAASAGAGGVSVVFAGVVHAALSVRKQHSYRLDAFSSGEAAPLGFIEEGHLRRQHPWPVARSVRGVDRLPPPAHWPRVEIVLNHAGAGGAIVRALVADGVRGIVAAGTGNGTLHRDLEAALLQAQAQGVAVRRTTRCPDGPVLPVAGNALPHASGLSPVQARVALMLELMA
jgi:L-asparaginase